MNTFQIGGFTCSKQFLAPARSFFLVRQVPRLHAPQRGDVTRWSQSDALAGAYAFHAGISIASSFICIIVRGRCGNHVRGLGGLTARESKSSASLQY